ncbi:unnamed protein product, partial [Staurois parvus]
CAASLGHSGSPNNGKSRRCRLGHVISRVQSQLITWDMYTDHQSTDVQSPPVSVHQCQLSSAHPWHLPVPMSATFHCPSVPHQCHISVPI